MKRPHVEDSSSSCCGRGETQHSGRVRDEPVSLLKAPWFDVHRDFTGMHHEEREIDAFHFTRAQDTRREQMKKTHVAAYKKSAHANMAKNNMNKDNFPFMRIHFQSIVSFVRVLQANCFGTE